MKKTYLSLLMICLCFITKAQVKYYEYPSGNLTEKSIAKILAEKKQQSDISSGELVLLDKILHKRMQQQEQDFLTGTNSNQKIIQSVITNTSSCINPGFENTTNSDWTFSHGDINLVPLPCNSCASASVTAINTVVSAASTVAGQCTSGTDDYGSFPVVAPGGGSYSLLLNDANYMGKIMEAKYSYVVTASSEIYTFQYAAVLNSGGHSATANPYFHVDITDNTTGAVIPCTQYNVIAPMSGTLPGWFISPSSGGSAPNTVYYKPWTTVSVDMTAIIGHTVTISYIVSDCANGGHFGYVYLDGDCGMLNVTNTASICSGTNANLCGPPGYATYNWSGPVTGSSTCLSTPTAGTYTLNMTSSTSCPAPQVTYTVSSNPAAVPSFSFANVPCNLLVNFTDMSTVSSGSITGWSWNFGDGTPVSNLQNPSHTYSAVGTYNVVMTCTTNAGCSGTFTTNITLNSLPVPIASTSVACNAGTSGSATVSPSGGSGTYTYAWSPSGGSAAIASGLGAGNYYCAVSDGAGCSDTAFVTITQPPALSSTQTITPAYCNQADGGAAITMSGGTGTYPSYAWAPTGGNLSSISSAIAGSYTCTVLDGNGCTYTTTAVIPNLPGPTIVGVSTTSVSCFGGSDGTATATVTGTGITYSWLPTGGNFSVANNLPAGNYSVAINDVHGCKDTSTVAVVIGATDIIASFTVTPTPCGSSTGSATVSATGGAGAYTYTWSPSPASGTANNVSSLGAGNYNCTIKDANGCSKSGSIFITTTTGPTVTASQTQSVTCNGLSNGAASVISVAGGTAPLTYTWLPGSISTNSVVSGVPAGTYTVIIQDGAGCFGSDTATVKQPAPFILPVVTGTVSCNIANANPSFPSLTTDGNAAVNGSGGTTPWTYSWVNSIGTVLSTTNSASGLPVGTYTCYITDLNGCQTHTVAVVNSAPQLTATVATTTVSCNPANTGNSSNGSAVATPAGGTGTLFYTWNPLVGPIGSNLNNSYANLPVGSYSIHITDSKNCIYDQATSITGPSAVTVTSTLTPIQCFGTKGSATVTPTGGASTSYTFAWTPSGGSTSVASNLSGTVGAGTNYTCTVTDVNSCKTTTVITMSSPTKITGTVTSTPVKCSGAANGTVSANLSNGTPGYNYSWAGTTPTQTTQVVANLAAGTYTLNATDANGCPFKKTVNVNTPEPVDSLKATGTLCSSDASVTLSGPTGGAAPDNITNYQWYLSLAPIANANSSTYSAVQANINNYYVSWIFHGCKHTTKIIEENILPELSALPQTNIFTPNGDSKNEDFYPFSIANNQIIPDYSTIKSMLKSYNMWVYDRWGRLMYSSSELTKPWDGKDAPDGTYYWIVNYQSNCNATGTQKIKGFVQLLR